MKDGKINQSYFNLLPVLADGEKGRAVKMLHWDKSVRAPPRRTDSQGAGHWPQGPVLWGRSCWEPQCGVGVEGAPAQQWRSVEGGSGCLSQG